MHRNIAIFGTYKPTIQIFALISVRIPSLLELSGQDLLFRLFIGDHGSEPKSEADLEKKGQGFV
jgi:hypothetical protein